MLAGRTGAARITSYDPSELPSQIAATILDFNPELFLSHKEARRVGRLTQLAIASTEEALRESQVDLAKEDLTRVGIEMGSAFGALDIVEEESFRAKTKGFRLTNPAMAPAVLITTTPCYLAIRYGIQGPVNSPVVACATGVVSLGDAARRISDDDVDMVLAGGTDAYTTALLVTAFSRLGAMSTRNSTPQTACRPFDAERDGMIVGEGAVTMVLESLAHALERGATILAEIGGLGFTSDGYNMAAPDPSGSGAARAMNIAIAKAGLKPEDIDYVAAHGTATKLNDSAETNAIKRSLGERAYSVPITSIKPMIGHTMGAAGAFGALTLVQAIRTGWVPPTINYSVPDPECDLDYTPNTARQVHVDAGIINAFGFGGQNGALVIKRYEP
jgi:3-oxoacyl-[acyl-carrier-protein] synthase II